MDGQLSSEGKKSHVDERGVKENLSGFGLDQIMSGQEAMKVRKTADVQR